MNEFYESIKIAEGMRGEIDSLKRIEKEIEKAKNEITDLEEKEKEIKGQPDRVEAYRKRLAKLQEEIEKQNAIAKKIESPGEIVKMSKILSQKQLISKALEYFSTLYSENNKVIIVDQAKIRVNYVKVSLVYNELLEAIRATLPAQMHIYVKTVSKLVTDYIVLYNKAISTIYDNALIMITYAINKKTEIPEKEIETRIVEEILGEQEESTENITSKKLYENISKLGIYEEILMEVKQRITEDLLKISLKQLKRFDDEVFYGTVYYIGNIDRWMCDNLVNKIGEQKEATEISSEEQRAIFTRKEGTYTIVEVLASSMEKNNVSRVSKELYKIVRILKQIDATERSKDQKIQKIIKEKIKLHLKVHPIKSSQEKIRAMSLRLADSQVILGMIEIVEKKSKDPTQPIDLSGVFEGLEEHVAEITNDSFADMILSSEVASINFFSKDVLVKIEGIHSSFTEIIERIFTGSLLSHIKIVFYNRILHDAYYSISSSLEDLSPDRWRDILYLLLNISKEYTSALSYYSHIESIYQVISYDGSAGDFIKKWHSGNFSISIDLLEELVAYSFKDLQVSKSILNSLEKDEKTE